MLSELKRIIDQISRDRGIDRHMLIEAIEEAVLSAARKKLGSRRELETQYNEEIGEVEVFQFRNVVETVTDDQTEVSLQEARSLDPEAQLGDEMGTKIENISSFGRIAAQSAKQIIIHKMMDAERQAIYEMYRDRVGEVVSGIVQRFERGHMVVNLGRTDAVLPREEQIPKRSFRQGDRVKALLLEVRENARDSQLILSRTNDQFLVKLFEMEVPEIAEDIVAIKGVSRDPGFRAKIAVSSSETDVDPVGACVGMKGSRVQNVVQELQGERIDIVPWNPDPAKYVYNALAPAQVSMVLVDDDSHALTAVVPDDQLSLAIGRQGQNVRLASKLLGWKIDVKSEQRYANLENPSYQALIAMEYVDENIADTLFANDIQSINQLARTDSDTLAGFKGITEESAGLILQEARAMATETGPDDMTTAPGDDQEVAAPQGNEAAAPGPALSVRVHELAKEAGIPSKEMVTLLQEKGYDVTSHSSSVSIDQANEIRRMGIASDDTSNDA